MDQIDIIAEIKKSQNELLNNSTVKTPDKAKVIAGLLLRRGLQPTWRLVRDVVGTGSATTLQNAVNQYWCELGNYLDRLEKRPELPKPLVSEFNRVWDNAVEYAEKKIEKRLKKAFDHAKRIEEEVGARNKVLLCEREEESRLKTAAEQQKDQLEKHGTILKQQLEQAENRQETLTSALLEKKKEYSTALATQKQAYQTLEQSLQKREEQLRLHISQQALIEKQQQAALLEIKQERKNELERQAKQYESMLDHYSHEIGVLKVKQARYEKQQNEYNQQQQQKHEKNLVVRTEQQAMITSLSQQIKGLEKREENKTAQLAEQQTEIQQLHRASAKLEVRLEILTLTTSKKK